MAVAIVVGAAVVTASPLIPDDHGEHHVWSIALVISVMVGVFLRALLEALAEVEAAQAERTAQAAIDERQRIAREVHDVIAHSMTVTMLHVTAARMAVEPRRRRRRHRGARGGRAGRATEPRRHPSTVGLLAQDAERRRSTARPAPLGRGSGALWSHEVPRRPGSPWSCSGRRRHGRHRAPGRPRRATASCRSRSPTWPGTPRAPGPPSTVDTADPVGVRVRDGTGGPPARVRGSGSGSSACGSGPRPSAGRSTAGPDGGGWVVEAVLRAATRCVGGPS